MWLVSEGVIRSHKSGTRETITPQAVALHPALYPLPTPAPPPKQTDPQGQMADQREMHFSLFQKPKPGFPRHKNSLDRTWSPLSQCFAKTISGNSASYGSDGIEMRNLSLITVHYILTRLPVLPAESMFLLWFVKDFR